MTWDWYDIEKLSDEEKKKLQQEFVEAGKLPALPNLDDGKDMSINEARNLLQEEADKKNRQEQNAEAGKTAPKMNLQELQEEQDKKERKDIAENLLEETKPKPPAKPKAPAGPKPPELPSDKQVGMAEQTKEINHLLSPDAPDVPPVKPADPAKPKESLSSKAKRLATKAKKVKGKIATSYGDSLIRFGKKNLKPSGQPRRITQKTGSRHPNLKVLNKPKTHLSNKVKEQLKPNLME